MRLRVQKLHVRIADRRSTTLKAVVAFFFSAVLCAAQKPANCYDSPEHAQQCLKEGDAEAEFLMGLSYDQNALRAGGLIEEASRLGGGQQDFKEAMKWYRLAALQGHPQAQFSIGLLYDDGNGVPQNHEEAFRWFLLAAESGFARAQAGVGTAYMRGKGVPQDYKAALDWLRKAAERGDLMGEVALGMAYQFGQGVPQDYVLAHMWYNLASAQGNVDAGKDRDALAAKMTPAQVAEAQRLAREFKPKAP